MIGLCYYILLKNNQIHHYYPENDAGLFVCCGEPCAKFPKDITLLDAKFSKVVDCCVGELKAK